MLDAEMDQGAENQKPRTSACCLRKIKLIKVPHQPTSKQLQVKRETNNSPKMVVCVGRFFFFFLMLVVVYGSLQSTSQRAYPRANPGQRENRTGEVVIVVERTLSSVRTRPNTGQWGDGEGREGERGTRRR